MHLAERQVRELLDRYGAVLERGKKHAIYRLRDGRIFSLAKTPSDVRGWMNTLSDLRHFLGIVAVGPKPEVDSVALQREHAQERQREVERLAQERAAHQPVPAPVPEPDNKSWDRRSLAASSSVGRDYIFTNQDTVARDQARIYNQRSRERKKMLAPPKVYSKEIIDQMNRIARFGGEEAAKRFLEQVRQEGEPVAFELTDARLLPNHTNHKEGSSFMDMNSLNGLIAESEAKIKALEAFVEQARSFRDMYRTAQPMLNWNPQGVTTPATAVRRGRGRPANAPKVSKPRQMGRDILGKSIQALNQSGHPMRLTEIWREVQKMPGMDDIGLTSVGSVLLKGASTGTLTKLGAGIYWVGNKPVPDSYLDKATAPAARQ